MTRKCLRMNSIAHGDCERDEDQNGGHRKTGKRGFTCLMIILAA
jgi:hypothetical protein